jgi:hypothetical protein
MKIKRITKPLTLAYETDADTIIGTVEINGIFRGASITVPNMDYSNGTVTATITNAEGGTVWSKASIAEGATTSVFIDSNNYYFQQPLYGTQTLTITANTGQTADREFVFYVYYE